MKAISSNHRFKTWKFAGGVALLLSVVLGCCVFVPSLIAQATSDTSYSARRQKASDLFNQGKRLEALPLVEELVRENPKDDQMLVALAACLVEHAATLSDDKAAGEERLRARDLLDKAWDLGNTSTLAMNLSELLKNMPQGGTIQFSQNPQVEQAMRAGEAAFAERNFDQAIQNYSRALELDPKNYTAALFTGNTYDKENQFAKATGWYERAIELDPNTETAYRYYADMLARQGDMDKARTMLIHAAVAEPYNRIVWRELHAWATLTHTEIKQLYVGVPLPPTQGPAGKAIGGISQAWQAYYSVKKNWQQGGEFKKHFPDEKAYRHSLIEESDALTAAARIMEKLNKDKKTTGLAANDPGAQLLLKLYEAGSIDAYVLFSLGDEGIARDYVGYRTSNRAKLEDYMSAFVVPSIAVQR